MRASSADKAPAVSRIWREMKLAVRLLWRDHRAGELALITVAIVVAVASVTSVGFFTDRVHQALGRQANQLLGADLVIAAGRPVPHEFEAEARARDLSVTRVMRFPSMAVSGDRNVLASRESGFGRLSAAGRTADRRRASRRRSAGRSASRRRAPRGSTSASTASSACSPATNSSWAAAFSRRRRSSRRSRMPRSAF